MFWILDEIFLSTSQSENETLPIIWLRACPKDLSQMVVDMDIAGKEADNEVNHHLNH